MCARNLHGLPLLRAVDVRRRYPPEALTTYAISPDDRLPRKAITLYGLSRLPDGLIQAATQAATSR
ncbi:MAG: hypothetical protein R3E79_07850 [Caldilineaceae bacterium]